MVSSRTVNSVICAAFSMHYEMLLAYPQITLGKTKSNIGNYSFGCLNYLS